MNKIIITLATLAALSGSALAFEKSDDNHFQTKRNSGSAVVTIDEAPFAASGSTTVKDIDQINQDRRGDSSGGNNN